MTNPDDPHRILRRLTAAEGYIELGMPEAALAEVESLDDDGPFSAPLHLLRGRALQQQGRLDDAITVLQRAANELGTPHNRHAFLSLSECFRQQGRVVVADLMERLAKLSPNLRVKIPEGVHVSIVVQTNDSDTELLIQLGDENESVADHEFDLDAYTEDVELDECDFDPDWN